MCGFPQSRNELKDLVQSYIQTSGKKSPFKDGRPGDDWVLLFEKRHRREIGRRKREGLSSARASGLQENNVREFYDLYEKLIKEKNVHDKPWLIYSCDEIGMTSGKFNGTAYFDKSVKNSYALQPTGTKSMYTVLVCTNAIGQYMPPYTVYKSKNLYQKWCKGGLRGHFMGFRTVGGWWTPTSKIGF